MPARTIAVRPGFVGPKPKVRGRKKKSAATESPEVQVERIRSEFQKRADAEAKRFENATDSEFWVALCFQTREQKEEFLGKLGLTAFGDKYIDGRTVADCIGLTLESPDITYRAPRVSKRWTRMAKPADEPADG